MTGEGIVVSSIGSDAVVSISKSSACGHDCASCGACSNPSYEIKVSNPIGAKKGDRVVIETDTKKVLAVSLVLYVLPVFLLILSAFSCEAYSLGVYSIAVFAVLLILWFFLIKLVNKKTRIKNTIVRVII